MKQELRDALRVLFIIAYGIKNCNRYMERQKRVVLAEHNASKKIGGGVSTLAPWRKEKNTVLVSGVGLGVPTIPYRSRKTEVCDLFLVGLNDLFALYELGHQSRDSL